MTTTEIVQQLDAEIAKLTRVRDLLTLEPVLEKRLGRPPGKKRSSPPPMPIAARKKISLAMKKRWANAKAA